MTQHLTFQGQVLVPARKKCFVFPPFFPPFGLQFLARVLVRLQGWLPRPAYLREVLRFQLRNT